MNKIRQWIQDRRDERFLRRLERVLNENILEADIIFRGRIAAVYGLIESDQKRGYDLYKGFADKKDLSYLTSSDERFQALESQSK